MDDDITNIYIETHKAILRETNSKPILALKPGEIYEIDVDPIEGKYGFGEFGGAFEITIRLKDSYVLVEYLTFSRFLAEWFIIQEPYEGVPQMRAKARNYENLEAGKDNRYKKGDGTARRFWDRRLGRDS